jgi:thiamine biosynthesis lipoprotein
MTAIDVTFESMGSQARVVVAGRSSADAVQSARAFLEDYEARLSRFRPDSELCALNAAPAAAVPASPLLRRAVAAALWAARRSGGLVDPTLLPELEAAGYDRDRRAPELDLAAALIAAPNRAPAGPHPAARWRAVVVDDARGVVRRPPGVRIDSGGIGKGLAADLLAERLAAHDRWAVDCGGDLRVGGRAAATRPFEVEVAHPLTSGSVHTLSLTEGAVATSGLDVRLWRGRGGRPAHHLLDPATGAPAWTGLIAATAVAPTAAEAETRAKAALLSGPRGARRRLERHGGLIVHEDGDVELCGPLRARPEIHVAHRRAA